VNGVLLGADGVKPGQAALQADDHSEGLEWAMRVVQVACFPGSSDGSKHPSAVVSLQLFAPTNRAFGIRVDLCHECLESLVVEAMGHAGDAFTFTR
jgi:hypothetical protein